MTIKSRLNQYGTLQAVVFDEVTSTNTTKVGVNNNGVFYSSEFNENVNVQNYSNIYEAYDIENDLIAQPFFGQGIYYNGGELTANTYSAYNPLTGEVAMPLYGPGQGTYMRHTVDNKCIVYNEIDEVTDFRNIVREGLVLDLDAGMSLSYPGYGTTWTDLSGNGNNGTLTNMDGTNFNSTNGGSLTFDGTNEYVNCGNPSSLNFGTGNFTLSFVTYTTAYGFQGGSYVGKGNGTTIGFDFRDTSFYVYGTLGLIAQGSFAATLNVWQIHTIVYDSSSSPYVKFYRNGTYTGASTTNNPANISSITTSEPFRIGLSVAGGPTRYFNGIIPSVQAYNRALTEAEIQQNYNALRSRFGL